MAETRWKIAARKNGWLYFTDLQLQFIYARFNDVDTGSVFDDNSCHDIANKTIREMARRKAISKWRRVKP